MLQALGAIVRNIALAIVGLAVLYLLTTYALNIIILLWRWILT